MCIASNLLMCIGSLCEYLRTFTLHLGQRDRTAPRFVPLLNCINGPPRNGALRCGGACCSVHRGVRGLHARLHVLLLMLMLVLLLPVVLVSWGLLIARHAHTREESSTTIV